jgi:uncharacterized coiled-coil protein SlyX
MAKNSQVRELIHDLASEKMKKAKNGSLTIKDAILLAAGTWVDSTWGTPLCYSEDILKEYAENWVDNPLWSRHGGGSPRSITDKIGEIVNQRYNDGAVVGDLVLHGKTQTSSDVIELITGGLVDAISVEHSGRERWDPDAREYVAEEIIFYGAAIVNKGACSVCKINNEANAEANMEIKELETKLAEAESKITELTEASATTEQITELETKIAAIDQSGKITELETTITELKTTITELTTPEKYAELEGRVEQIENTPLPEMTLAGDAEKELGEVHLNPIIRDTEGITRRVF